MRDLIVDPYFRGIIPPLSDEEFSQLEENILAYGCRDAIKHWKGTIVDGHNRYAICKKHGLPYAVKQLRLGTKKDATVWIIENQLGRRNLTKASLIGLGLEKARLMGQNVRKTASKFSGASEGTVYQYMKIVEHGDPKLIAQLERGEETIGKVYRNLRQCPHSDYKLDIITKTVDVWYDKPPTYDINNPRAATSIIGNIEKSHRIYSYIAGKANLIFLGDEMDGILTRLERQRRAVRRMLVGRGRG